MSTKTIGWRYQQTIGSKNKKKYYFKKQSQQRWCQGSLFTLLPKNNNNPYNIDTINAKSWQFNKLFRDAKTQLNMCCAAGNSNNARAFFWDLIDGQIMFRKESKTLCKTTIYLGKSKEMIKPWIINIKMGGKKWIFLGGLKQFIVCILLYWTHNYLITQIFATMEKVLRFPNTMIAGNSYGFIVSDKRWLNFWVI